MPIVILTEDEAFIKKFSTERIEVFVMSMKQYLEMFWSHVDAARNRDGDGIFVFLLVVS